MLPAVLFRVAGQEVHTLSNNTDANPINVQGYEVGPVACEAAFVADFDVSSDIPMNKLVSKIDIDRQIMFVRNGMRSKYVPFRFDPATGAHQIGGRYLFDTWNDVVDYMRFTTEELEFEPGVKFWDRPFFSNIDKRAWKVIGAHEFVPLETHYASRFERFAYEDAATLAKVEAAWAELRDAAQNDGLASVWLLAQPDERQVGLVTANQQVAGDDPANQASCTLLALERKRSLLASKGPDTLKPLFDRASLNISLWLPRSAQTGGDASIFPTFPVHPKPQNG